MMPVMQSLWVGDRLSIIEQLALASFVKCGHKFHLYTYNPVEGVPYGVIVRDANEILPKSAIFKTHKGSLALFADLFRWKLLYERGGYWVDTDMVCLKPFDFADELVFGRESYERIAIGVLAMPAKHHLAEVMLNAATAPFEAQIFDDKKIRKKKFQSRLFGRGYEGIPWTYIAGPGAFTAALNYLNLTKHAKSHLVFYPINCANWDAIFDSTYADVMEQFNSCYAIHLWNEMMRRKPGFDKNGCFPDDSLIEKLKAIYLK